MRFLCLSRVCPGSPRCLFTGILRNFMFTHFGEMEVMLLQLAANVAALSSKPHPPPPPPPPPLIPLEGGGLFCNNLSLPIEAKPLIVVFGGSNTAGTNSIALQPNGGVLYGRHIPSFVNLLRSALPQYGQVGHIEGGSGPSLFGACASQFVPPQTRIGIVEFLPNIGYAKEDKAELAAIKLLLQMMHSRGAATYLVNILSGTNRYVRDERSGFCGKFNETMRDKSVIGCMSRARVLYFHEELKKIALATHAHVISRDADETPELFGADSFHINVNGHRSVFNEIWQTHRTQRCKEPSPYQARDVAAAGMGVLCALGPDLEPLVREAVGFRKVDSARVDNAEQIASMQVLTTAPCHLFPTGRFGESGQRAQGGVGGTRARRISDAVQQAAT